MKPLRFLLLALSAVSSLASAQANRDPLIPRELAEALLAANSWERARPEIVVGLLPARLAPKVTLPASAKILGGMTITGGGMAGPDASVGVILLDGPLNSVASEFHRSLIAQGWEVPVDDPMSFMRSEFVDPPGNDRRIADNGRPEMYCGRAGTLNVVYRPDGFQRTQISLSTTSVNQCALNREHMLQSRMAGMPDRQSRPKLVNHPGARNSPGACPQQNMGMGDRKTDLGSQMAPSEILAHYAKQLADSGWAPTGTSVAAVFQKRDTTGTTWEYQLLVHSPTNGAGCRSVRSDLNGTSRR